MKRLMLAFAVISVSGCLCAKECKTAEDCATGQICGSQNLCEAPGTGGGVAGGSSTAGGSTAGGRAGGMAGGTGGSSTAGGSAGGASGGTAGGATSGGASGGMNGGGMTAGGMTAGGMGGGTATCVPGCDDWQICDTTGAIPTCGVIDVEVTAPTPGSVAETSVQLTLAATARYDGGVVRRPIPVEAMGLSAVSVPSNGMVNVTTPATAQSWTLRFGWDGGARVDREVEVRGCNGVSCGEWQSCTGTVDGGRCVDGLTALTWVAPDGGPYAPGVMVPAQLTVTMSDGGTYSGAVPVTGAVMTSLTGATNTKQGALVTPVVHGPFTVTAGWVGGPLSSLTSRVDAQGPGLTLVVEDAPARLTQEVDPALGVVPQLYRKDERAFLRVEANEDVNFAAASVSPTAIQEPANQCTGCTNPARCQCYSINLDPLSFNALRGVMGVSVSNVRDGVGNASQTADGGIQVTRWKWGVALPDGLSARAAPALDSRGRLYVGTIDANNNNGNVYQVGRQGQVSLFVSGAAVQSIAVAETVVGAGGARQEVVYIASNTSAGGNLHGRLLDGGVMSGSGSSGCYNSYGLAKTFTAVALFDAGVTVGGMEVGAAGMFEPGGGTGTGGALCAYRPFNGPAQVTEPATMEWVAPSVPTPAATATNMVAVDNSIYLLQSNRQLRRFFWLGVLSDQGSGPAIATSGTPVSLAASPGRLFATVVGPAQPFVSMDRTGAQQSNFGNSTFAASGPVVLGPSTSASVPSPALVYASTTAATGDFLQKLLTSLTVNTAPQNVGGINFTPTGAVEAATVLGSPRGGATSAADVLLYAMRRGGVLQVMSVNGSGATTAEWAASLFSTPGTPSFYASPTLDCRRDAAGAGVAGSGTFFAVTSDGRIAAVIVDSPKLATDAPWPKWQRTAGNAGNPGFPLNPGCPP